MKKLSMIVCLASLFSLAAACTKTEGPSAGKKVGEIYVTSQSGAKSVLVSLQGLWSVTSLADWISIDVNGRSGQGAFTMKYESNESDLINTRYTRLGAVLIHDLGNSVVDTLYIRQQGCPDGEEYTSTPQDSYIEFIDTELVKMTVKFVSFKGCEDVNAVRQWIESEQASVIALTWTKDKISALSDILQRDILFNDSTAIVTYGCKNVELLTFTFEPSSIAVCADGVNVHVADFSRKQTEYTQMVTLLDSGYNCPGSASKWIVGGTLYQLSAMEVGYPDTPSWYPSDPSDQSFDSDIYAQNNQLTDCVWMTSHKFNPTFSEQGKSWRADYAYASSSVWSSVISVKVGEKPLPEAFHNTIELTLKY